MKKLCLIILCLLSLKSYSQTTSWSSTPVITWQNRLFGGSPQLRGLIGTSNVFSLSDSLNARPTLTYADARYVRNQGSTPLGQFYVNYGAFDDFVLGGYFIGNKNLSSVPGGIIVSNMIAFGKTTGINNAFAFMGTNYKIASISANLLSANSNFFLPNVTGDTLAVRADLANKQPLNAKLTAIAALANASGALTNNGSGVFSYSAIPTATDYIQNKYGSTGVQANSKIIVSDTIRSNTALIAPHVLARDSATVGVYPAPTTSVIGQGTSIMAGSDATTAAKAFFKQTATALNSTATNNGVSSSVLGDFLNPTYFNSLPNYVSTVKYIFMLYGTNDVTAGLTVPQYTAKVSAAIDSLHTIKGYPLNKIVWIGTPYNYLFTGAAQTQLAAFAVVDSTVSAQKGVGFVEMYHYMLSHGGNSLLTTPGLHPNNDGHKVMFTHIMAVLSNTGLLGNAFVNNNLVVNNMATIGHISAASETITGSLIHSATIDTLNVPYETRLNYTTITNPRDSLDFKTTVDLAGGIRNTVLLRGGSTKVGAGINGSGLQLFGYAGINFGASTANYDAWTLKPSNAAYYIDGSNINHFRSPVFADQLSVSSAPSSGDNAVNLTYLNTALATKQNTLTLGTGVLSALSVNIGSTGAIVPLNGAYGTPSSLTLTNATGLPNAGLLNSTISGISLGSNLANLTATNTSLTFSGTYNGGTARTIGINLGNTNTWTITQGFAGITNSGGYTQSGTTVNRFNGKVGLNTTADAMLNSNSTSYGTYGIGVPDATFGPGNTGGGTTNLTFYRSAATNGYSGIESFLSGVGGAFLALNNTSGGAVGVGYSADPTSGNKFAVNGNSYFNGSGTFLASISTAGNLTAALPAYSSGTRLLSIYNSTNSRFETTTDLPSGTTAAGTFNLKNYTVATLPAGTRGDIAYVTDALAPTYLVAVVGGGAVVTPVFYDGANWISH